MPVLPKFSQLPLVGQTGERHTWDVFGRGDQLGTINLLTPDRVKRAALTVSGPSETSTPRSGAPPGLIPHATPAALKPCGSPPERSVTFGGGCTQRERKNPGECAGLPAPRSDRVAPPPAPLNRLTRFPRLRAGRTSGSGSVPPARRRPSRGCRSRRTRSPAPTARPDARRSGRWSSRGRRARREA